MNGVKTLFVAGLVVWQTVLTLLLTVAGLTNPKLAVLAMMVWGLNLLWLGGCGILSLTFRERVAALGKYFNSQLWLAFFGGTVALALSEEAITTAMTNCAPLFGARLGEVYITASANYFDVVLFHSVVVFLPQFAVWGVFLKRYAVSPFTAFVCYGLTGFINEALFAGPNLLLLAQWMLVYGLLIYLPANLFADVAGRRKLRWWFYPCAVVAPIVASIPVVALMLLVIAPGHPRIHFPPM